MARFPKTEPKIAHLAQQIADGLAHAAEQFPSPPVPPAVLQAQLDDAKVAQREAEDALAKGKITEREAAGNIDKFRLAFEQTKRRAR